MCDGCDQCGIIADREECADFTKNVIKDYLNWRNTGEYPNPDYKNWVRTYKNFACALAGSELDAIEEEQEVWNIINVSSTNYKSL